MDVPEQDYHNFSTPSSHRLPTVSGAEAIRNARRNASPIATSLPTLDGVLGKSPAFKSDAVGGIQRGIVTEVFGPPGVGKTTFALQVAVNALLDQGKASSVTWIDTSSEMVQSRLEEIMQAYSIPPGCNISSSPPLPTLSEGPSAIDKFNYLQITSLPRLLALFMHAPENFPPPNTGLIVLDDLSHLILSCLPRTPNSISARATPNALLSIQNVALSKRALSRRFQVLSSLASALQKFAATNSVAIVINSKATVNFKPGQRAFLKPALSSQQWDSHLSARIALFRDFWPKEHLSTQEAEESETNEPTEHEKRTLRLAKVVKLAGKLVTSPEIGFVIEARGLREVTVCYSESETSVLPLPTQTLHPLEDTLDPDVDDTEHLIEDGQVEDILDGTYLPHMPELEAPGRSKRKAIEIADSDGEIEADSDTDDALVQPEQRDDAEQVLSQSSTKENVSFSTARRLCTDHPAMRTSDNSRLTKEAKSNGQHEEQEEMLLEVYEKHVTPFSQAAADMSEPLTPSDDDRDIS